MRIPFRSYVAAMLTVMSVAACSGLTMFGRAPDAARKTFIEADALFADAEYAAAINAYAEFIRHYPSSSLADDAYLRIMHVLLYRADGADPWPDVQAARDTLHGLMQRYPDSDRTLEARNMSAVIELAMGSHTESQAARDSLTQRLYEQQSTDARVIQLRADRARLTRKIRELEERVGTLVADTNRRESELQEVRLELERSREETDRMRRILRDLERGRSGTN